jgi:hypothetical protein
MLKRLFSYISFMLAITFFYSCNTEVSNINKANSSIADNSKKQTEQNAGLITNPNDAVNGLIENTSQSNKYGDLSFLKKYNGKYPSDVKLLDHPIIKNRLTKLIGKQYDYLKEIWVVETPIEISGGLFFASAMESHSGGDPGAVIMADFKKNVLFVGIRKYQNVRVYSEDRSKAPKRMLDWSME